MIQKNKKKNILIYNILHNFNNVNRKLNSERKNIYTMKRQILTGNKVLSSVKILNNKNNNRIFNSLRNIKEINKNYIDDRIDTEIKSFNRLNIYNYIQYYNTEQNRNIILKNNISEDKYSPSKIIKSFLDNLSKENKNKIIQNKLRLMELHDCNKRKKLKLKPINMKLPLLNYSISKSNKSIFTKKIIYYNRSNKLLKDKKNEKDKKILGNENTSYYSTLFKNTTVNIIKKKNGEIGYENPFYSPSLNKNLWEDFQIIDNEENESYEKSLMIKEGINEINKNPLYLSGKKAKKELKNKNDDITKIKSIKDIESFLFRKNSAIYKNIKLNENNLKPINIKGRIIQNIVI